MRFPLRLTGLVAAPHTPFDADGGYRSAVVGRQARLLMESGVHGAFIGGTTGESLSLTVRERMLLTEDWADACATRRRW